MECFNVRAMVKTKLRINSESISFVRAAIYVTLAALSFEGLNFAGLPLARTAGFFVILAFIIETIINYGKGTYLKLGHILFFTVSIVIMSFSLFRAFDPTAGFVLFVSFVSNIIFFIIFCISINNKRFFKISLIVFAMFFIISTFMALFIDNSTIAASDELIEDLRLESIRQAGFLRNPNRYGYLGLIVFWSGLILYTLKLTSRKISQLIIFLSTIAIILSLSRSVILGLVIGFVYLAYVMNLKRSVFAVSIIFSLFLATDYLVSVDSEESIINKQIVQRFSVSTLTGSGSTSARTSLWKESLHRINENPVLGTPMGSLQNVVGYRSGYKSHDPHNTFMFLWQYFGILGLFTILATFIWILRIVMNRRIPKKHRYLIFFMFISMMVPNIFHSTLSWKATMLLFCFIYAIKNIVIDDKINSKYSVSK